MPYSIVEIIAQKRDGHRLSRGHIDFIIGGMMNGSIADYQVSAWLMACFLRGLDSDETIHLTQAMLHSGIVLDLPGVSGFKVDKHSTGGVGDKVSIALAPLVASCAVPVPMVSGRGLGHTGGTLDKLEAIPGFRTDLSVEDYARIVRDVGTCMIGQTREIAPADKKLYALRDVTATVESVPLIVASILSKKLAEGIDGLVLDVKVGKGAFMKTEARARELAEALVRVGEGAGKRVVAVLTRMDAPLGVAVGNANETREALLVLHGKAPADVTECTLALSAEMLVLGNKARSTAEARDLLGEAIASGRAIEVAERMIAAQHGDARVAREPDRLDVAKVSVEVVSDADGFVDSVDAEAIGLAGVALGAGRTRADQAVDHAVGISVHKRPGDRVVKGEPLATLHVHTADQAAAVRDRVHQAFGLGPHAPSPRELLVGRIAMSDLT